MTPPSPDYSSDMRSSAQIEADIRRTRGRMDATLEELGERLTARHLINTALDWWETPRGSRGAHAARKAAGSLGHTLKEHPMPSLLIGAGLAWLLMESREETEETGTRASAGMRPTTTRRPYAGGTRGDVRFGLESDFQPLFEEDEPGVGEKAKQKLEDVGAGMKESMSSARERLSHGRERIGDWTHERSQLIGRRARRTVERGRSMSHRMKEGLEQGYHTGAERLEDAVEEHPLAVGLGFAALGALFGLLLPRSRRENEWMGGQSDHLMEIAREKSDELLERGKAVGERVKEAAIEGAREQGLTPEAATGALHQLKHKVGEVVHRAKEEAGSAMEDEHLTPEALKQETSDTQHERGGSGSSASALTRPQPLASVKPGSESGYATEPGYGDVVKPSTDDDPADRPAF
jgi:ElaB/YqjD/DUF883 family membrane-anchored ribosome-binding protein